ncbi:MULTISPECIES: polysaccharide pyruvyl transferase family protein [Diplocloster]|uniref:Polysaccharide pyruvyl transferase family protein n=1 Tax=Diplocloster modestus TaxID=2850322 RepID=A0ABS6K2P5_9FIRM|nr:MULTISPECIES: polysaccharide pyruvyl transferase family protein [Diplocloster]MBU9724605.1 polysaccharide pyruvyl transferase family protein [Diplocloster modestus]MBU9743075.1 polysaccharide pyruvyl transferase family protein [Diplocloster agilis]
MNQKKYILITGTGFVNKGSQAMLFTAVDELKRRFPDKEIIDLSTLDYQKPEAHDFSFRIEPDYLSMFIPKKYLRIRDMGQKLMRYRESPRQREERRKNYKRVKEIYENTYFIVNAGGFALGAPIGRGKSAGSLAYLMRIMAAKELKVPIYLLPQSFGPFDYKPGHNFLVKHLMKKYMDYPRLIFAREQEGYECLLPYRKSGLLKEKDIVITNVQIDKQNIYKAGKGEINNINIKGEHPVAVIPNMMSFANAEKKELLSLYKVILGKLIETHDVFLMRHSKEDIQGCQEIAEYFGKNDRLHLLLDDMNCFELEYVLGQFEFCIASRFHSIIHAYKNGTPCVVLGWAVKYKDLLEGFEQTKYLFDVREEMKEDKVLNAIAKMEQQVDMEKETLNRCLLKQQESNAFDLIEENINEINS